MSAAAKTLEALRAEGVRQLESASIRVLVGMGTCGRAAGAQGVFDTLRNELADLLEVGYDGSVVLDAVGCKGLCYAEPLVVIECADEVPVLLGNVDAEKARTLAHTLRECVSTGELQLPNTLSALVVDESVFASQERRVLENCGDIDPTSLAQYVARGGYIALQQALERSPSDIISEVTQSGLRGRGGAGFPTGRKWQACIENDATERYFIMNGDEGDPGAYMDRGLLESDPHRVLEGLIIGSYATGAHKAYCFIRAEYPLAVRTMKKALADAYEANLLGPDILGSGFDLDVEIVRGAGAFLCGESTAMVNVLENGECTTRNKPPHLTEKGLWGKPTCLNNVETLACIPSIITNGASWFASVGTSESPGTKIFSVTGAAARGGLVEVPLGTPLGVIVNEIAQAANPKAVQIGGPSGAILPATLSDLPMSYEGLSGVHGMMGSGGFVVISNEQCVVETASYLTHYSARQSCRKCRPCGNGLDECAEIFDRITAGEGTQADLERLEEVATRNCSLKLCGLGRTALSPVLSSLHYFRDEYEAHLEKCCPGLTCSKLISYEIDQAKCQGERCCLLTCPGNAVKGRFGKPGHIVERLCQKCGMCAVSCPYGAVRKISPAV